MTSLLAVIAALGVAGCASPMTAPSAAAPHTTLKQPVIIVQAYARGLAAVHSANSDVKLRVGRDATQADDPVLFVEYPRPTDDPAGRDVWCDADVRDWTGGSAISFQIKPAHSDKAVRVFL